MASSPSSSSIAPSGSNSAATAAAVVAPVPANDPLGDSPSFDVVQWVNDLLAQPSRTDDADEAMLAAVRSAGTRLQVASQELSRDVNRFMERLLTAVPRADQELDRLDRDAAQLKQNLKSLQTQVKIQDATPFKTLADLDTIKVKSKDETQCSRSKINNPPPLPFL